MEANDKISSVENDAAVKVRHYPGKVPKESVLPEKLAKANGLLKTVKDLDKSLEKFKKTQKVFDTKEKED